ncbi:unnamed protein product [Lathyrus sativus]|nr:unnamed protein product [Lathyrus sativus]
MMKKSNVVQSSSSSESHLQTTLNLKLVCLRLETEHCFGLEVMRGNKGHEERKNFGSSSFFWKLFDGPLWRQIELFFCKL